MVKKAHAKLFLYVSGITHVSDNESLRATLVFLHLNNEGYVVFLQNIHICALGNS